ncbi:MAG: hypothetical protein RIT28_3892 [Pseudomonadota bacterium]|jgi:hypothetical protein
MSLTAFLLFTLPNVALAEDGCEDHWSVVEEEGAYYLEDVGCVVGDYRSVLPTNIQW